MNRRMNEIQQNKLDSTALTVPIDSALERMRLIELAKNAKSKGLPLLVDTQVAATMLGCSYAKLTRDRWSGIGLPYTKPYRKVSYDLRDVLDLLESKVVKHQVTAA